MLYSMTTLFTILTLESILCVIYYKILTKRIRKETEKTIEERKTSQQAKYNWINQKTKDAQAAVIELKKEIEKNKALLKETLEKTKNFKELLSYMQNKEESFEILKHLPKIKKEDVALLYKENLSPEDSLNIS